MYDPFARPENVYAPETLAVVVAVDVPVNAMVAPLPDIPTPPVIVQVDAAMLSQKVLTAPAALAVTIAVCEVGTVAATDAENPALTAPAATVTLAGTVRYALLLAKETTNPPASAAELNVTVHAETPAGARLEGLHVRLVSVGWIIVIVPPTPVPGIELPDPLAATTPLSGMGVEVCNEPEATVNVTVAKVPLPMMLEFIPETTHVVVLAMLEHAALLLAAMALGPSVTLTLEISEDEYPIVHSTSEGCALPDAVIVTGRVTIAPGAALPDPIATVTDCAKA